MITTKNYFTEAAKIVFSDLPEALKKGHDMVIRATKDGKDWGFYEKSEPVRNTIDLYLQKLNDTLEAAKPDKQRVFVVKPDYSVTPTPAQPAKQKPAPPKKPAPKKPAKVNDKKAAKPKNLAELKRFLKVGDVLYFSHSGTGTIPAVTNQKRVVELVQSASLGMKRPDGKTTFLEWPKASEVTFTDAGFMIDVFDGKAKMIYAYDKPAVFKTAPKEQKEPVKIIAKKPVPKKAPAKKKEDNAEKVEHLSEEMKLIIRFDNMEEKVKTRSQVLTFLRALKKAIKEKKIRKTSKFASLVRAIQEKAAHLYEAMKAKGVEEARVTFNKDADFKAEINKVAASQKVRLSINYLKRFINMQGLSPDKKRVENLHRQMKAALANEKIAGQDPYLQEVKKAVNHLDDYINNRRSDIALSEEALNGLMGLQGLSGTAMVSKKKEIPSELKAIFSSMNDKPKPQLAGAEVKVVQLPGDLGKFLGLIERLQYVLLLRGNKGAGKTRLLYQLLNLFAGSGYDCSHFSLEIPKNSDLVTRMKELYIEPKNEPNIKISSEAPKGIETIRLAAQYFDVVAIDSWGKLHCPQSEMEKLAKEFPNTFFLIIFQSTTAGTARGGSQAEYDAGSVLQVNDGGLAEFEKNRYATSESMNAVYSVFDQKLIGQEQEELIFSI